LKYPKLVRWEGTISYKAFRTPFDSEPGIFLNKAMVRAFGKDPIKIRISGGSLPIAPFVDALQIPAVTVVTVNSDNNQHGPNENIRLGNYKEGIKTALAIFTQEL
jgi:acetylornithine deacetylase/succinyl-diaminopimelate desuccinylase-like protein